MRFLRCFHAARRLRLLSNGRPSSGALAISLAFPVLVFMVIEPCLADTVQLKDGRVFTNVRTRIEGKQLRLESADGTVRMIPLESLRAIEPGRIVETRSRDPSAEVRPTRDPSPAVQAPPVMPPPTAPGAGRELAWLWAPVPVWSGMIPSDHRDAGIAMALLKSFAFIAMLRYNRSPEHVITPGEVLILAHRNSTQPSSYTTLDMTRDLLILHQAQVRTPGTDNIMRLRDYEDRRTRNQRLFGLLVILDGGFTWAF